MSFRLFRRWRNKPNRTPYWDAVYSSLDSVAQAGNVVPLHPWQDGFQNCHCGSVWWELKPGPNGEPGAVALTPDGTLQARSGELVCGDCKCPQGLQSDECPAKEWTS